MAKDKGDVPHYRAVRPGNPEMGLLGTIIEQRGIRAQRKNVYKDPAVSAAERMLQDRDPLSLHATLQDAANLRLKNAGEPSYIDTIVTGKDDQAAETKALFEWLNGIMVRHGELSPVTIAARYLFLVDRLGMEMKPSDLQWAMIFDLCDAWHWLHFEEHGEHDLALAGYKAAEGRAAGPTAKAEARQRRNELIALECLAYLSSDAGAGVTEPKAIAGAILARVTEAFSASGWKPYQEDYLRRVVSQLLPNILSRVTGQSRQQERKAAE